VFFLSVVRVYRNTENTTISDEVVVNFGTVTSFRPKRFYDTAEEADVTGTELVFVNGDRMLVGDSVASILNRLR
jgi:hypothetical protein